jgi:hypothetical protein
VRFDEGAKTLFINVEPKSLNAMKVRLKGLVTWDPAHYALTAANQNTGLILSVRGIPYFTLDLKEYGAISIPTARPGEEKTCLVLECDAIQEEMNISRSGLVDSAKTEDLKQIAAELFQRVPLSWAKKRVRHGHGKRRLSGMTWKCHCLNMLSSHHCFGPRFDLGSFSSQSRILPN